MVNNHRINERGKRGKRSHCVAEVPSVVANGVGKRGNKFYR
jgi:hypothetical protein